MSHRSGCSAVLASFSVRMAETDELSQQNPEQNPGKNETSAIASIDASQAPCRSAGLTLAASKQRSERIQAVSELRPSAALYGAV